MGRAPCCDKVGLKKGPWTAEEDQKLTAYINENGHGSWRALPKEAGLLRCGKSCRLRWTNYLRPDIKRGEFTATEEQTIIQLHALLGNRWSSIAAHLPKRTDNEIKNYWNTHLKKRLIKMGLDPTTHKPRPDSNPGDPLHGSSSSAECNSESTNTNSSASSHMAQWESVRLEAEARLAREAELRAKGLWPTSSSSSSPNPNPGTPASLTQAGILPNQSAMASPRSAASWPIIAKPEEEPKLGLPAAWDPAAQILSGPGSSMCGAKPNVNALDLMNAIHNWEKSLQGQAGLLWPDSWRSSTAPRMFGESSAGAATSGLEVGHESSCCSSPLNYNNQFSGSPTSTLCSLDHTPKKLGNLLPPITGVTPLDALDPPMKRLSWSDTIHPHGAFNDLILGQNTGSGSGSAGDDTSSFSSCLHTLMDMEADDDVRDAKSEAFEKEFKQDVKACPNLSNLALVTESSSLLGEFELTSTDADISSSHYSSSNADDEDHQIGYGALLTEQDYKYCDWNSMLKEVVDSV